MRLSVHLSLCVVLCHCLRVDLLILGAFFGMCVCVLGQNLSDNLLQLKSHGLQKPVA